MNTTSTVELLIADRIWIATALLHQEFCLRADFTKDEIRRKLELEGLNNGVKSGTLSAHLDQHCVANVPPSSGKYRMLYETTPGGNLRLFRPGDFTFQGRTQGRKLAKSVPNRGEIPHPVSYTHLRKQQRSSVQLHNFYQGDISTVDKTGTFLMWYDMEESKA